MSSGAPTAAAAPRRHSASVYGATVDSGSGPADPREVGLAPGTRVHQFEIIRELGRGGMGQVVLARDTKLARLVALKFLALDGPRFVERFLVEARATARCQHEHIVVIYEADEWHGVPYMALEYLEGRSLADHLVDGPLPVARAVELMTAVVRALARAHDHHLVHCDLKPDNIFVTTDGVVKVLDFGIARLFTHNADGERLRAMQRELKRGLPSEALLDDPSSVAGTPPYMAFEQWGTEPIDHRTDLWAVGIIFWELIGGRHPLGTPTMPRILDAVANLDVPMPSIATACPDLAPALVAVIDRCLAKRKDGRFADARALLRALDAATSAAVADDDRPPFPGMAAFQEADAKRFFGREREVQAASARLAQLPLVVLAGPSGVGKSSFVRAGLVPALRAAGRWQVVTLRPGRDPLGALVAALAPLGGLGDDAATRLMTEPGLIGEHLRAHARARDEHVLVYVDQFEETFTLGADAAARAAFVAALTGVAVSGSIFVSTGNQVTVGVAPSSITPPPPFRALLDVVVGITSSYTKRPIMELTDVLAHELGHSAALGALDDEYGGQVYSPLPAAAVQKISAKPNSEELSNVQGVGHGVDADLLKWRWPRAESGAVVEDCFVSGSEVSFVVNLSHALRWTQRTGPAPVWVRHGPLWQENAPVGPVRRNPLQLELVSFDPVSQIVRCKPLGTTTAADVVASFWTLLSVGGATPDVRIVLQRRDAAGTPLWLISPAVATELANGPLTTNACHPLGVTDHTARVAGLRNSTPAAYEGGSGINCLVLRPSRACKLSRRMEEVPGFLGVFTRLRAEAFCAVCQYVLTHQLDVSLLPDVDRLL
jgi:serine/threonine protein kinase